MKMAGKAMMMYWGLIVMVVCMTSGRWSEAQLTGGACVGGLTACQSPLKNTNEKPLPTCCIPLKNAIHNQTECLCNLFNNPPLLQALNVTKDQIFSLAERCNISGVSSSTCSSAPAPGGPPPPGTKSENDANAAASGIGISLLLALTATLLF